MSEQVLYRSAILDRKTVDADKRTVDVALASETPVERSFGMEILSMREGDADLSLLNDSAPVLENHDASRQIGVIVPGSAKIGPDKVLRCTFRFSRSAQGEAALNDCRDGIKSKTSLGYIITGEHTPTEKAGKRYVRVKFKALEGSLVALPADQRVGVGRAKTTKEMNRPLFEARADGGGGAGVDRAEEIRAIAKHCRDVQGIDALATRAILEDWPSDQFRKTALGLLPHARAISTPNSGDIGMSTREVQDFSLVAACRNLARNKPLEGLEREASEAAQKQMRRELTNANSFIVPPEVCRYHDELNLRNLHMERAQNVGAASAGGFAVSTQFGPLIELLRNKTVLGRMGITIMDGLVGDFVMPVQTGGCTAYWVSETGSITDSEATFGQKAMVPHRIGACIPFTMQFLAQNSISAESWVRTELDKGLGLKKDLAGLLGTGVGGEPLGVANTTGINATVTYGGAAVWADIVQHETGINVDNADIGSMGFVIDGATTGKWKTILRDSVAGAGYLLSDNMTANGYPVERTEQIATAHQSFFGVWSELILGIWAGREVTVDNITLAKQGQHQIIMNEFCDFLVRQPLAFNVSTDSAAQ